MELLQRFVLNDNLFALSMCVPTAVAYVDRWAVEVGPFLFSLRFLHRNDALTASPSRVRRTVAGRESTECRNFPRPLSKKKKARSAYFNSRSLGPQFFRYFPIDLVGMFAVARSSRWTMINESRRACRFMYVAKSRLLDDRDFGFGAENFLDVVDGV